MKKTTFYMLGIAIAAIVIVNYTPQLQSFVGGKAS